MATVEKISVALPPGMLALVREAVETGEYSSSSEVIREALRNWTDKRNLQREEMAALRRIWREARADTRPGVPAEEVMSRLVRKYKSLADASER
jgi:antitoxin ParD1/3/4